MKRLGTLLLAVFLVAPAGCGSKGPAKITVKGRVLYHGEALPGGAIVFVPDADRGNTGPLVKVAIQDDGTFSLSPDTAPGWYRIAVAPVPAATPAMPTPSNLYPGPPARYRNPQLSSLAAEIKPGVDNVFEFRLEDL